ncbi:MAG: hypothetical protein HOO96_29005, partial [Polyangiaceae bacterium]|nr:hypothetical protein [Polyangiaceae bacterium]
MASALRALWSPRASTACRRAGLALGLALALSFALAPRTARADCVPGSEAPCDDNKAAAAKAFREGQEAFAAQKFAVAASAFEEAHRRIPRAAAIYNAALAWDSAGDAPRAADDLWIALETTDLHGAEAEHARSRLAELEGQVATVDVSASDGSRVTVAHVQRKAAPLRVHLSPGRHSLVEHEHQRVFTLDVSAGQHATLAIPAMPKPPSLPSPSAPPLRAPDGERGGAGLRTAGWVTLSVGLAGGAGAAVLGGLTLGAIDEFASSDRHDAALHGRAQDLRTATIVTSIAAAGAAVTGLVLVVVG